MLDLNQAAAREVARTRMSMAQSLQINYPEMEHDRMLLSRDNQDLQVSDQQLMRPVVLSPGLATRKTPEGPRRGRPRLLNRSTSMGEW